MEEKREILVTRTFTYKEVLDLLTNKEGNIFSFEMQLPRMEGQSEWRRINLPNTHSFIKIRTTEPLPERKEKKDEQSPNS